MGFGPPWLVGFLAWIGGCAPDPAPGPLPRVEFGGCFSVSPGPICYAFPEYTRVHLWVDSPTPPRVTIDGEAVDVAWTAVQGGQRGKLVPERSGDLEVQGTPVVRLVKPEFREDVRGLLYKARSEEERDAAREGLVEIVDDLEGMNRFTAEWTLCDLGAEGFSTSRIEQLAVKQGEWWWAARSAGRAACGHQQHSQGASPLLATGERTRRYLQRVHPSVGGLVRYVSLRMAGIGHRSAGDYRLAMEVLQQAERHAERSAPVEVLPRVRGDIGGTLLRMGRVDEALASLKTWAERDGDGCELTEALNNYAWALIYSFETGLEERAKVAEAVPLLHRALEAAEQGPCAPHYDGDEFMGIVHVNLALAAMIGGDPGLAQEHLDRSRERGPPANDAWLAEVQGRVFLAEGNVDGALDLYRSLEGAEELETRWMAKRGVGRALEARGEVDAALSAYSAAQDLFVRQSLLVPAHLGRAAFLSQRRELAERMAELRLAQGDVRGAFDALRTFEAQYLYGLYQMNRWLDQAPIVPGWQSAVEDFEAARRSLERLPRPEDVPLDQVDLIVGKREGQEAKMRRAVDKTSAMVGMELSTARRRPEPGEVLLGRYKLGAGWVVFAESPRAVQVQRFGAPPSDEEVLTRVADLVQPAQRITVLSESTSPWPAHRGVFKGAPLMAHAPVRYGLDLADRPTVPADRPSEVSVVVDPSLNLKGAKVEAKEMADRFAEVEFSILVGEAATRAATLEGLQSEGLFHYSGHGEARTDWDSGLMLADGPLSITDILMLRQEPQVVVLNACETGRQVDGASISVGQAFTAAGTPWVVATDEPVADEEAVEFSRRLYLAWIDEEQPLEQAFARAVMGLRDLNPNGDWAAFRLLIP